MRANLTALVFLLTLSAIAARWFGQSGSRAQKLQLPPAKRAVHLVTLDGDVPLNHVATEIRQRTGLQPTAYASSIAPSAFHSSRGQFDAETVCAELPQRSGTLVIGLTSKDLYTSKIPSWRYCFGVREADTAVISCARMGPGFPTNDPASIQDRLAKMTLRYILEGVYGLPRNENPSSLLYSKVLGPWDLDRMEFRI